MYSGSDNFSTRFENVPDGVGKLGTFLHNKLHTNNKRPKKTKGKKSFKKSSSYFCFESFFMLHPYFAHPGLPAVHK